MKLTENNALLQDIKENLKNSLSEVCILLRQEGRDKTEIAYLTNLYYAIDNAIDVANEKIVKK